MDGRRVHQQRANAGPKHLRNVLRGAERIKHTEVDRHGPGMALRLGCRWRDKGGTDDLLKARHYIDLLLEFEGGVEN